jgi:large subunit ribosomal protein L13
MPTASSWAEWLLKRPAAPGKAQGGVHPHIDVGDHVVVVNAATVRLTGRKEEQKLYRYHSGYEGGLREERAKDVRQKNPVGSWKKRCAGMLPKTKMGEAMWRKLKVTRVAIIRTRRRSRGP